MIDDDEMARNIEASAALAQWIELMRTVDGYYRKMAKTAQVLIFLTITSLLVGHYYQKHWDCYT